MPRHGEILLHGTCVALAGAAVLLRGAPGAGKSDLALRFVSAFGGEGAALVADDQVRLRREGGGLVASPPPRLAGLVEVRGVGIVSARFIEQAPLVLIAELCDAAAVPRLPPDPLPREDILGVSLPVLAVEPFAASAPLKLKLRLGGEL